MLLVILMLISHSEINFNRSFFPRTLFPQAISSDGAQAILKNESFFEVNQEKIFTSDVYISYRAESMNDKTSNHITCHYVTILFLWGVF
jgi:hypothetical protein